MRTSYFGFLMVAMLFILASCEESSGPGESVSPDNTDPKIAASGKAGSMARMTILGDYLYAVDKENLKVFDITKPDKPSYSNDVEIGRDIETIFGFKNHLYIGSNRAVYIYNVDNPTQPQEITMIQHMLSCDPVVANDTVAFSTIRSTSVCRFQNFSVNELLVLDVSNMNNVTETHNYQLDFSPYGLGMKDTTLFLCKGENGIALYDIRELSNQNNFSINSFNTITGIDAFDVIVHNNLLMVVGNDGYIMYDISDVMNIQKLSEIQTD